MNTYQSKPRRWKAVTIKVSSWENETHVVPMFTWKNETRCEWEYWWKNCSRQRKNDLFSVSLGIIKVVQMNEASSLGVGIGNVSPVKRGEPTSNTIAWVAVGASASAVEVAVVWEFGSVFDVAAGETGSVMIGVTCSFDPGVWVISIEEDSVGRAVAIVFKFKNFPFASRAGNTVGGLRDLRFFTSTWPGTRATLLRFCWYRAIASGFPWNVGNAIFKFFVVDGGSAGTLVCNSFVLFFIAWISSLIARFASANKDKSVCNVFDGGWGGVNNTEYMLENRINESIDVIRRLLKIKFKIKI